VFVAPEGQRQRDRLLDEVETCLEMEQPFWLVVNPAMITYRRTKSGDSQGVYDEISGEYFRTQFPFLMRNYWNTVTVDEAHECGLSNPSSQTARALHSINTRKRMAMTGTPAGGKPDRYWGLLNWLNPTEFRSRYQWREKWLDTKKERNKEGRTYVVIGGFKNARMEERFYDEHSHYILRRTKKEVASDLPEKNHIPIWVTMLPEQEVQYRRMEDEAEAVMEEMEESGPVISSNVLTTYMWLKQFSFGLCDVYEKGMKLDKKLDEMVMKYGARARARDDKGKLVSPKLEALYDIMEKIGVVPGEPGGKLIVFSQFEPVIEATLQDMLSLGYDAKKITGKTPDRTYRKGVQEDFQTGKLQGHTHDTQGRWHGDHA
jgi:SNF2 family DNA or RNA helicase